MFAGPPLEALVPAVVQIQYRSFALTMSPTT
jgi:hypothetical protein